MLKTDVISNASVGEILKYDNLNQRYWSGDLNFNSVQFSYTSEIVLTEQGCDAEKDTILTI